MAYLSFLGGRHQTSDGTELLTGASQEKTSLGLTDLGNGRLVNGSPAA